MSFSKGIEGTAVFDEKDEKYIDNLFNKFVEKK